jgi:murein DD-endopeptidase MepM/ murein hydrolase activator NlpD
VAARNYPLGKHGHVIGTPYQGTHAVAFNKKGGSNNWQSENAYDLAVPVGTPVYAVTSGTIGPNIGPQGGGRFAGDRVSVVSSNNEFFYGHLSSLVVNAGQNVSAGQLIGYSGEADGVAHLHFASKNGDPAAWFTGKVQTGTPDQPPQPGVPQLPAADTAATAPAVTPPTLDQPDLGVTTSPDTTQPFQPPPGSGPQSTNSFLVDMWNRIASQPGASPDAQLLAANAQLATGSQ